MQQTGVRSGLLLFVLGLFVLMRTVNQDQSGRTLIDHILGKASSSSGAAASPLSQAAASGAASGVTPAQNAAAAANTTRAVQAPLSPLVSGVASPFAGGKVRVTAHGITSNVTVTTSP